MLVFNTLAHQTITGNVKSIDLRDQEKKKKENPNLNGLYQPGEAGQILGCKVQTLLLLHRRLVALTGGQAQT